MCAAPRTRPTQLPLEAEGRQSPATLYKASRCVLPVPAFPHHTQSPPHTHILKPSCTEQRGFTPCERGRRKRRKRSRGGEHHPTGQPLEPGVADLVPARTWLLGPALSQHAHSVWQPEAREGTSAPACVMEATQEVGCFQVSLEPVEVEPFVNPTTAICGGGRGLLPHFTLAWSLGLGDR